MTKATSREQHRTAQSTSPGGATRGLPSANDVRDDIAAWIAESWIPDLTLRAWRERLLDARWACPSWPTAWFGRGYPDWLAAVVAEELARFGVPAAPGGVGMALAAPTLHAHGSGHLKELLLRPLLTGEHIWCQLFSEPGSGSDLAGLSTRAELDDDEWVVTGQKLWSTSAHHATYGMLLARTNWDVPKHRGLTYFILPMEQQGVEVRPLRQSNGYSSFNEAFLSEARVPRDLVVGEVDDGWKVASTTLANERRAAFTMQSRTRIFGDGRAAREAAAEAEEHRKVYCWYPQRAGRADLLISQAQSNGRHLDPTVRQEIARVYELRKCAEWTAKRASATRQVGRQVGPEGSLSKLQASAIARASARTHSLIGGARGMLAGRDGALDGVIAEVLVSVPAISIAGGTDEIQRNILAERVLGLPTEPRRDVDLPFRQVLRN